VSIAEVVQEALNIAKYYKRTKGRHIETTVAADLPAVMGVRDQLVQVFLNLILNAIDATDTGGRILVRAEMAGGQLVIYVEDNGVGIALEHQPRLFQPYFTTKKHGTGLGLFVTRALVVEHGGTIEVTSQPGAGTHFRICLPTAPCVESRPTAEPAVAPS
jgi:signal transduction histidine kinase